jgi:hypothetical protein
MRKILLILFMLMGSMVSAQIQIKKIIDEMTNDVDYMTSENFVLINKSEGKGLTITPHITPALNVQLILKSVNIGNCVEKGELIIMFQDSSKINLKSWNKFNCENYSYFKLDDETKSKLSESKIIKMRFTNGRTYDSLTGDVLEADQKYFMQFFESLNLLKLEF